MAIVTLEDLQGSIEVVVFPRLFETTRPLLRDGAILLIAGRVDHKGEEVSLLADLVADWDDAASRGTRGIRARRGSRRSQRPEWVVPTDAGRRGAGAAVGAGGSGVDRVRWRGGRWLGGRRPGHARLRVAATRRRWRRAARGHAAYRPAEPVPTYLAVPGALGGQIDDMSEEPPVPDEARARIVGDAQADAPLSAGPGAVLHVRFEGTAGPDRLVRAMETVKAAPARSARWDEGRVTRPGVRRRSGIADGAARGRGLRRGAARGSAETARRRPGRDAARRQLGVRPGTTRLGGQPAGSMPITVAAHGQ